MHVQQDGGCCNRTASDMPSLAMEPLRWGIHPAGGGTGLFALLSLCCGFQKRSSPSQLCRGLSFTFFPTCSLPSCFSSGNGCPSWVHLAQDLLPVMTTPHWSGSLPRWSVSWSTRCTKKGWGCWICSVWRREGQKGVISDFSFLVSSYEARRFSETYSERLRGNRHRLQQFPLEKEEHYFPW